MIEINLVPDVKQQLIHAQRVRTTVISLATLTSIVSGGVVVLLALYVFGVQTVRSSIADNNISSNSKKLAAVPDINKTLTIQNQLAQIPTIHDAQHMNSRIFDVLTTITPASGPNQVQYSNVTISTADGTVTIQAQTPTYASLDTFKKTIAATKFNYTDNGNSQSVDLASNVNLTSQTFAQDANGNNVLTFTLTFTYPPELMSPTATNASIVGPNQTNATDSYLGVPNSLFTQKANSGGNQ